VEGSQGSEPPTGQHGAGGGLPTGRRAHRHAATQRAPSRCSRQTADDPIPPGSRGTHRPLGVPRDLTLPSAGQWADHLPPGLGPLDLGSLEPEDDPIPPGWRGTHRLADAPHPAQRPAPFLVWS